MLGTGDWLSKNKNIDDFDRTGKEKVDLPRAVFA